MILEKRVALVTGAGSGIGRASASILAREGAKVIVTDRLASRAKETVEQIRSMGFQASWQQTDVTVDTQLELLVEHVIDEHGCIDIVHSHAGIQVEGNLEQVEVTGMDASWALNVRSHFQLCKLVMPHMVRRRLGSIVITASNSGVLYDREMIAYATSKHAVVAMARQMALDYATHNIRINALCPGWVDTPFNDPFMKQMGGRDALEHYVQNQIPMGRWASSEEIAEAVLFMASPRSSFMTGQAMVVDGGESLAGG
ncbi:MAG: SDR family NAD(P)-dependent oxidoreductase [Granulosicoccus sp.]